MPHRGVELPKWISYDHQYFVNLHVDIIALHIHLDHRNNNYPQPYLGTDCDVLGLFFC